MRFKFNVFKKKGLSSLLLILGLSLIILFSGCSKNSGGDDAATGDDDTNGDIFIDLTDNRGDFQRYALDVVSIELVKASGEVVKTLPITTRVDFAQYTEMTEFITACTVPSGTYVSASMVLDYTNADIRVEDESGGLINVAPGNLIDEDGNKVSVMSVSIQLEDANAVLIKPGAPAHLSLDFDLKSSNSVEWVDGKPVVTVSPVLLADLEPHQWKTNRLRGPLEKVQPNAGWFDVIIRPFMHAIDKADVHSRFGTACVYSDSETLFVINGEHYQGDEGLKELNKLDKYSAVLVFGRFIKETGRLKFSAREVIAGSSVAGGTSDVVAGNVIARQGDEITLRGATLVRDDGTVIFHNTVEVDLSEAYAGRQFKKGLVGIEQISVGQRLLVFGELSGSGASMKAKYAHMYLTAVAGTVNSASSQQIAVNLQSIDGRNISIFDFDGTGSNPDDYLIGAGALNISDIISGNIVKAYGFPVGFGFAETLPDDFNAWTIINVSKTRGMMSIGWNKGGSAAAVSIISNGLRINLDNAGPLHHMFRAGIATDLAGMVPSVIPEENKGVFCISQADSSNVFSRFDKFSAELDSRIKSGSKVKHLFAGGLFDDASATVSGRFVAIRLK